MRIVSSLVSLGATVAIRCETDGRWFNSTPKHCNIPTNKGNEMETRIQKFDRVLTVDTHGMES